MQCNTIQYNTIQYIPLSYNTNRRLSDRAPCIRLHIWAERWPETFCAYLRLTKRAARHAAGRWRSFCRLRNMFDNTIQYNTIQYSTVQYSTVQHNTIQYNTIQCNTIHYIKLHYNTIHYKTLRHITVHYNKIQWKCNKIYWDTTKIKEKVLKLI